jgi:hypothetical protein
METILELPKNLKSKLRTVLIKCALNIFILKVLWQITGGHFYIRRSRLINLR